MRRFPLLRAFLLALVIGGAALLIGTVLGRVLLSRPESDPEPVEPPTKSETRTQTWDWLSQDTPPNPYDPLDFSSQDGVISYHGSGVTALQGVDISAHNGDIDWKQAAEAGIDFAILQLGYRGYTAGNLNVDEAFFRNLDGATDAGVKVGVYFFSQAKNVAEAEEEARFVVKALAGCRLDLPIYFDWETVTGGGRTDAVDQEQLTAFALAFCRIVEDAGFRAGIYFNQHAGYYCYNLDALEGYSFWLAEYSAAPSFYFRFDLWQYSADGSVPGIEGAVDRNLFFFQ